MSVADLCGKAKIHHTRVGSDVLAESTDAIVVLGCRMAPGGTPFGASLRRARHALSVYRRGVAPWLIASGGRCWHGVAEAEAYRRLLLAEGVPGERVLTELESLSTRENARYVSGIFRERGWKHAALVSCDWHLPRAIHCFERAGIRCEAFPAISPPVSRPTRLVRALRERLSRVIDRDALF